LKPRVDICENPAIRAVPRHVLIPMLGGVFLWVLGMSMVNRSSSVNSAASPEDLHKLFEQALNSGDLDALVALYAYDGFLMARSGPARGVSAIRKRSPTMSL
jgi:hypothetical protein